MNRSIAQAISRNYSASLQALEAVIAEAKYIAKLMQTGGAPKGAVVEIYKAAKSMSDKRNKQAVIQWKLKKVMMGNPSYLTGDDLNSVRSFLKESINLWEENFAIAKANGFYKEAKQIRRNILREANQQREVRKLIVAAGRALRGSGVPEAV